MFPNKIFGFFNKNQININDEELALSLYNYLYNGDLIPEYIKPKLNEVLSVCHSEQDILDRIIMLCSNYNTPRSRFLTAMAYVYSTKRYRKESIRYLLNYLNNPLYDDAWNNEKHNANNTPTDEMNIHISEMYSLLGKAYEGEYMFDEALASFKTAIQFYPSCPLDIVNASKVIVKMNKLQDAMCFLENYRHTPYYAPKKTVSELDGTVYFDDWYKRAIDHAIMDVVEKINKGYVYRPRKRK